MKFFVTHGQGLDPFVKHELRSPKFSHLFRVNLDISDSESERSSSSFHGKIIFSADAEPTNSVVSNIINSEIEITGEGGTHLAEKRGHHDQDQDIIAIAKNLISNLQTVERIFGFLFQEKDPARIVAVGRSNRKEILSNLHSFVLNIGSEVARSLEDLYQLQLQIQSREGFDDEKSDPEISEGPNKRRKKSRSFRVNAKVSGKWKRLLNPRSVAPCIGSGLVKSLSDLRAITGNSWEIDLRNPTLEVSVYLTDDGILSGVSLTPNPLSNRDYLNKIPLRSTIAYSIASLAVEGLSAEASDSEPGSGSGGGDRGLIVLDPMCGSSIILVELAKHFPQVQLAYGLDHNPSQLEESLQNISKSQLSSSIVTLLADSTKALPFRSTALLFDAVVCDLPFGLQHSSTGPHGDSILPLILTNIDGAVKDQGNIVLLISLQMNLLIENIIFSTQNTFNLGWKLQKKYPVKLGELPAIICHYKK